MGCTYDADNISNLFKEHKESAKFTKNIVAKNKTKSEALNLIKNTFQDAQDNDISYLFWSGHGTVYEDKFALVAKDNIITVYELQTILDDIKGTKVIFIDTCHSGLAIDKNFAYTLAVVEEKLRSIDKTLNKQGYKVLTASAGSETSGDLSAGYNGNPNPSGAFTWALTQSIKTKNLIKIKIEL
ncbi:caspase family protein [Clostridium botulinum]|nr:caspase family protein [Clostridium botulinum]MCS4517316.1 caspase family protein [Clostridium botulinum]